MTQLERELRALELEWPQTPALVVEPGPRRSRRPLVLALAALLLALAVAFAVPPARAAILRFLHLGGETVEFVDALPPAAVRSLTAGLGPQLPLGEAERVAGFRALLPPGGRVAHAYARRGVLAIRIGHGLLLTELVPSDLGLQKKLASGASRISYPEVNGDQGIWIEGGPHVVALTRPDGGLDLRTLRLAGNVLVWQHGARTLRLEGPIGLDEALKLARTIR